MKRFEEYKNEVSKEQKDTISIIEAFNIRCFGNGQLSILLDQIQKEIFLEGVKWGRENPYPSTPGDKALSEWIITNVKS